ncbi:MAG: putative type secretion ATPase protein TadA [Bacilli bacterium]|nr:putative type secretion ATPase protein TadA [Bacilli bacterium]
MKRNSINEMIAVEEISDNSNIRLISTKTQETVKTKEKENSQEQFADEMYEIKMILLRDHTDLFRSDITDTNVKFELQTIIERMVIDRFKQHKLTVSRRDLIVTHIMQGLTEYGAITDLYYTLGVTDIHINCFNNITYRLKGKLIQSAIQFASEAEVRELAEKLLRESDELSGRKVNWTTPIENGMMKDGSRFNIMIDPVSTKGTSINIRKHREGFLTENQHLENGTFTLDIAEALKKFVEARANILVVGGGGTGKTEIMRLLGLHIRKGLKVDQIEDSDELKLHLINPNVRPLIFRRNLLDGQTGSAADILRWGSLRSDVDIVVIGEILENNTFIICLDAMGIGQPGSSASMHADGPRHALDRGIQMYASEYPNLSETFIMRHIANTIDVIITVGRDDISGDRKLTEITQLNGIKDNDFDLEDLYQYRVKKGHCRTDVVINSRIRRKMEKNGVEFEEPLTEGGIA